MNITYEMHTYQRKKDKENGKKGKEKLFKFSGYAYTSFLESLNTLIYVSSTVFCGKKATCSASV